MIGKVGDTGNASGCHLHFELWRGDWNGRPDVTRKLRQWDECELEHSRPLRLRPHVEGRRDSGVRSVRRAADDQPGHGGSAHVRVLRGSRSHTLDRDDYGRVVVLWSAVFLTVSVLFRPIEQLLTRTVAELDAHGQSVRHVLRVAASVQLGARAWRSCCSRCAPRSDRAGAVRWRGGVLLAPGRIGACVRWQLLRSGIHGGAPPDGALRRVARRRRVARFVFACSLRSGFDRRPSS